MTEAPKAIECTCEILKDIICKDCDIDDEGDGKFCWYCCTHNHAGHSIQPT